MRMKKKTKKLVPLNFIYNTVFLKIFLLEVSTTHDFDTQISEYGTVGRLNGRYYTLCLENVRFIDINYIGMCRIKVSNGCVSCGKPQNCPLFDKVLYVFGIWKM